VATDKPSRVRRRQSAKSLTSAQKQRHLIQIAQEKTEKLEHQMFKSTLRQTKLALVRQKGRADTLRNAGVTCAEKQPEQPKQKPLKQTP